MFFWCVCCVSIDIITTTFLIPHIFICNWQCICVTRSTEAGNFQNSAWLYQTQWVTSGSGQWRQHSHLLWHHQLSLYCMFDRWFLGQWRGAQPCQERRQICLTFKIIVPEKVNSNLGTFIVLGLFKKEQIKSIKEQQPGKTLFKAAGSFKFTWA